MDDKSEMQSRVSIRVLWRGNFGGIMGSLCVFFIKNQLNKSVITYPQNELLACYDAQYIFQFFMFYRILLILVQFQIILMTVARKGF